MQIALPQKAIIAKRNASPANLLIKPLIYMAFFLYPAWHADCIIDTDNQPTIQFG